jgi:hypothetical protein
MLIVTINLKEAIDKYYRDFNVELSVDHIDDILNDID